VHRRVGMTGVLVAGGAPPQQPAGDPGSAGGASGGDQKFSA